MSHSIQTSFKLGPGDHLLFMWAWPHDIWRYKNNKLSDPFDVMTFLYDYFCSLSSHTLSFSPDSSGGFHIMSSVSEMLFCHAYALRVQHIYQLKSRNVFLTVGDDEDFCPLIRVWNLDKVKIHVHLLYISLGVHVNIKTLSLSLPLSLPLAR